MGGGGGGPTLTFNKSGEEDGEEEEEGMTADRFYKGVRQVRYPVPSVLSSVVDQGHVGTDPDPRIRASDQWIRIMLFSSLTFKTPTKKFFCLLLEVTHLR